MTLKLRDRIFFSLLPMLVLLASIGSVGVILLLRMGNSANAILRENYDSVIAMEHLNEALERIDSAFQFAMSGRADQARRQYSDNWALYRQSLQIEENNVTLPGEDKLVAELIALTESYRKKGDQFFAMAPTEPAKQQRAYYDPKSLLETFGHIKDVSGTILRLNQNNMETASRNARRLAVNSAIGFVIALAIAIGLALLAAWSTMQTILRPMQSMTQAARAISEGNLDQIVPYTSEDELGELAKAFNTMTHHLREIRRSQSTQLLRAQRASQATIDSFPDPVVVIDSQGFVELANPAARRLFGVLPKHHGNPTAGIWTPPEPLREPLAEALGQQRDYSPESFDRVLLLRGDGGERALLPHILTIRDSYGYTLGAAVVLQDVTRLRLLDQVKSNLVATASHELKTPLTSIRLAVHLLLEETVGHLNAKQTELLLDARENSERLLAMINNLLDLARLEQGWRQLDLEPERPETLLRAAADVILPRAQDHGVELVLDIPQDLPKILADSARMKSALSNLLDNALAYVDRGGKIILSARGEADTVELAVADSGVGIPAEALPHVFEKFFRVPGRSKGSGTGLGLAIVHEIVVAHGGSIACESAPGKGTVFRMHLPIASSHLTNSPHG